MAYVGKIRAKDINTGKWLTLYKKLIKYRLTTPLEEIYDNEVYQHHHIYPKSI